MKDAHMTGHRYVVMWPVYELLCCTTHMSLTIHPQILQGMTPVTPRYKTTKPLIQLLLPTNTRIAFITQPSFSSLSGAILVQVFIGKEIRSHALAFFEVSTWMQHLTRIIARVLTDGLHLTSVFCGFSMLSRCFGVRIAMLSDRTQVPIYVTACIHHMYLQIRTWTYSVCCYVVCNVPLTVFECLIS